MPAKPTCADCEEAALELVLGEVLAVELEPLEDPADLVAEEVPLVPLEADGAVVLAPLLPPVEAGEEPVVPAAALPDAD